MQVEGLVFSTTFTIITTNPQNVEYLKRESEDVMWTERYVCDDKACGWSEVICLL